jgi:hypothetical protein
LSTFIDLLRAHFEFFVALYVCTVMNDSNSVANFPAIFKRGGNFRPHHKDTKEAHLAFRISTILNHNCSRSISLLGVGNSEFCSDMKSKTTIMSRSEPSSSSSSPRGPHKVIIVDWDDTILPSTFVDRWQIDTFNDLPLHVSLLLSSIQEEYTIPSVIFIFS